MKTLIIGAGPGGYELAAQLAKRGETVIVAERDKLGGTCLNRGCIPTKALCASAKAVLESENFPALGVDIENVRIDYERIKTRVAEVVDGLREGVDSLLKDCTVIHGEASFIAPNKVRIGDEILEADRIIIASGSKPAFLNIPGADLVVSSDEALWLDKVPESIVIVGGGVIGMEFASVFSALGSKVTVIEYCDEILPTVDPEIAKRLRKILKRRGIDIITSAAVQRIEETDGKRHVSYIYKSKPLAIDAQTVIMAVGRRPVIPSGFTEQGGCLTERGFIETDEYMQTSIPGVYAIGDVNGKLMLAHAAYAQGRVILDNDPTRFNLGLTPSVVFTYPEVASVGIYRQNGTDDTYIVKRPFASIGKACADGQTDGIMKLTVSKADNRIVNVTILGHHASELIAEATILVTRHIPLEDIPSLFSHAHPTLSEIFT